MRESIVSKLKRILTARLKFAAMTGGVKSTDQECGASSFNNSLSSLRMAKIPFFTIVSDVEVAVFIGTPKQVRQLPRPTPWVSTSVTAKPSGCPFFNTV
jgi:hypothetical protein